MRARRTAPRLAATLAGVASIGLVVVTAIVAALFGASASCLAQGAQGVGGAPRGPAPGGAAAREIPAPRLHIYMGAARRFDLSWPFLASIGFQECGTGTCAEVAPSGCAGAMQIAYVRGSACSPDPSAPTLWERFRVDADGGGADIFSPTDSIYTAAHFFRAGLDAPPAGGPYRGYYQAACSYYGACSDASADYAHEVMARAVEYGFGHEGGEATGPPAPAGSSCGGGALAGTGGASGEAIVRVARSQLGVSESPPGSNCTRYGPCEEWCALFVAWVWEKAGVGMAGGTAPYAYSGSFYSWVKEHGGRDLPPTATPAPGDAVMFGTGPKDSAHVGIVESVFAGSITTIDGNYGGMVARVGPFSPALARAEGEPAPIWAYAEPPGLAVKGGRP